MFILKEKDCNFLSNLSKEDAVTFRRQFISNIMFTDIKVHFDLLKDFEARSKESGQDGVSLFG